MGTNKRRLGVSGKNLPTQKAKVVEASDFLVGGIIGQFERAFNRAYVVQNPTEFQEIFGLQIDSAKYGNDAVTGFFNNVSGVDAKLYVVSHAGYDGSVIDGVTASAALVDGTPETVLTLKDGYQEDLGYGTSGNRTGYTITNGVRHTGAIKTASTKDDTFIVVDQPAKYRVGDIVKVEATGVAPVTVYKKITSIDEAAFKLHFSGVFHASSNPEIDDIVTVLAFRLRTYRKETTGIVREVDEELGKIWCSTESENTDYYVENVFSVSKWLDVTRDSTSPATLDLTLPVNVATVTYLASGAAGTAPTTAAHWSNDLTLLNTLPVRMIANPETTTLAIQQAMETYCRGRDDTPKVIYNIGADKTKAQMITEGGLYQRSDDVLGTIVADWVKVEDPFTNSVIAPARIVPNVGHVMGTIIRTIGLKGIHYIPQKDTPVFGIVGVDIDNSDTIDDNDRTDIAEAGVNLLRNIPGFGYVIRNLFTPSISTDFQFFNGIMLREYIKVSSVDSLQTSENQPNSFNRIVDDKTAIQNFLYNLWAVGSTGTVPEGETFGQSFNDDGTATDPEDHFDVQADIVNNPQPAINSGERNLDVFFTYAVPAGSIQIGVGILLR